MPDLFDNRLGLTGLEFIEFTAPALNALEPLFERMGFMPVARHRDKDAVLYRRGGVNFLVNREQVDTADHFVAERGPSACGLAFRVKDANKAYALALKRGARPVDIPPALADFPLRAIEGVGGAPLYLLDHAPDARSIYEAAFELLPRIDPQSKTRRLGGPGGPGDRQSRGRMAFWGPFYERLFGFREIRFVEIDGRLAVFTEHAASAGEDWARSPPKRGVQDIGICAEASRGGDLHGPLPDLCVEERPAMSGILLNGSTEAGLSRLLLQVFNGPMRAPAFSEFIKRRNCAGPGEGRFKALFTSVGHERLDAPQPGRLADSNAWKSADIPSI
jgi:4-hydroxyphenylpyruvate dioxygenase